MIDCDKLLHPFQFDKGTNQDERLEESPLQNLVAIDGRSISDFLHFLYQMSSHINYYNKELYVSDWKPFFQKSLPFKLAEIAAYRANELQKRLSFYDEIYQQRPSRAGLQLYIHYFYYAYIQKIDHWFLMVRGNALPMEALMEKTMREDLSNPLKEFLQIVHKITNSFCIKKLNTMQLLDNEVWQIDLPDLVMSYDTDDHLMGVEKRMTFLLQRIQEIVPIFENAISHFVREAEKNIQWSLQPSRSDLKKNHAPHLGLLFSFLQLYQYVQKDLNALTRRHLDYFYKEVLQIKAKPATPDKAHVLFQIQKNLDKYLLKKGEEVKDGKDKQKAEIYFGLDDEIVVNQTKIASVRTLFLNHKSWNGHNWIEGVYMAPDALKANGVDIDFTSDPKYFPTLGEKFSKYADPETKTIVPYPNARLGFLLASPVLLLNEGNRTVNIHLHCKLEDVCTQTPLAAESTDPCCEDEAKEDQGTGQNGTNNEAEINLLRDYVEITLANELNTSYYVITKEVLTEVAKLGISKDLMLKLQGMLEEKYELCYCPQILDKVSAVLTEKKYKELISEVSDPYILSKVIKPQNVLNLSFSGEEEWIVPATTTFHIESFNKGAKTFVLRIEAQIQPDQPAVTFYNAENLKEDLGVQLPSVRLVLNDAVKIHHTDLNLPDTGTDACCLTKQAEKPAVSFYHLFRNLRLEGSSKIDVTVCGVKNLIVQNDENLQDVNKPILPFGPRPKIGSSFYIGSKEIFFKNWQEFWINAEWKDKPKNLKIHYEKYHYKVDFENGKDEILDEDFDIKAALLEDGEWINDGQKDLFPTPGVPSFCSLDAPEDPNYVYHYQRAEFPNSNYSPTPLQLGPLATLNVNSRFGFTRLTLKGISFQHDRYPFVLARTLMAYAELADPIAIANTGKELDEMKVKRTEIVNKKGQIQFKLGTIKTLIDNLILDLNGAPNSVSSLLSSISNSLNNILPLNPLALPNANAVIGQVLIDAGIILTKIGLIGSANTLIDNLDMIKKEVDKIIIDLGVIQNSLNDLNTLIDSVASALTPDVNQKNGLPNEPYTPTIKSISIDYKATAEITDIELVHLYPFKGTYKKEVMQLRPTLLPTFCAEGTLYLGLKELVPGNNLNLLFQLAEATSDSESDKAEVLWDYLDSNAWKPLRKGFDVLNDATEQLISSGIVKLALPENMTTEHTVMPPKLHWIKASSSLNTQAVAETIGIHPQAIRTTFTKEEANDTTRLSNALEAEKIKKLRNEKAEITKVQQPYPSFDGSVSEESGPYYVRVSERLRHKGRAIQKWDYEHLLLDRFPNVYTAKCIGHSLGLNAHEYSNDFPIAPGYMVIAVIPNLEKLVAGDSFEPKVPLGALDKMAEYILKKTSPFVRIKVMNPRYEKVNICLTIKLLPGKDENFYKAQVGIDMRHFLAPWTKGNLHDISFGRSVNRSNIIGFLESRDYLDYILDIRMRLEDEEPDKPDKTTQEIPPRTPRSILIAGEIDVCIKQNDCEEWGEMPCENKPIKLLDYCNEENYT